jgi:hypothetical protein
MMNRTNPHAFSQRTGRNLDLAVRLAVRQLSEGIGIDEAIQFAAKYHNVTCSSIESELRRMEGFSQKIPKATILSKE